MPLIPTLSTRPSRPTSFSMSGPITPGACLMSCSSSPRSSPSSSPDSPISPTSSTTGSCLKTPPGTLPLPRISRTARPSSCMMRSCTTPQGRSLTSSSFAPSSRRSTPRWSSLQSRVSRISRSIRNFTASVSRVLTLSTSRRATLPPTTRSRVRPSTGSRPPASPSVTNSSPSHFSTLSARSIPSSSSVAAPLSFRPKTSLPSASRTPSPSLLLPPSTRTCVTDWSPARCTTHSSTTSEPSAPFGSQTPLVSSGPRSVSLSTVGSPLPPGTISSTSRSRLPPFVPTPRIPSFSRPSPVCPIGSAPTLGRSGAWLPPRPLSPLGPLPALLAGSSRFTPTVSGCSASTSLGGDSGLVSHSMAPSQGSFGRPIQPAARQCSSPTRPLSAKSLLVWQTGVLPPPSGRACSPRPLRRTGSPIQPWP
uniref:p43 n=1 Tax=Maize rayado fino virus TaxID=59749 RepID=A0A0A1DYG1_9VIRU|nr:p43 [Maize rayado fino virus]